MQDLSKSLPFSLCVRPSEGVLLEKIESEIRLWGWRYLECSIYIYTRSVLYGIDLVVVLHGFVFVCILVRDVFRGLLQDDSVGLTWPFQDRSFRC